MTTTKVSSPKASGERIPLTFDFTSILGAATISGTPTATYELDAGTTDDSANLPNGAISQAAGIVSVPVKAGTEGQDYRITVTADTSDGRRLMLAMIVPVRKA